MRASDLITDEPVIAGVNIVPVIDLCLVLLIILMVTSPLLETADIPVKLPQAITIESKERNVAITLATDGRWAFNSEVVPEEKIDALFKSHPSGGPENIGDFEGRPNSAVPHTDRADRSLQKSGGEQYFDRN